MEWTLCVDGGESRPWQAREEVLSYFSGREGVAKRRYEQFVFEGIVLGKREELGMGKLRRSGFAEEVLAGAKRLLWKLEQLRKKRVDLEGLLGFIGREFGVRRAPSGFERVLLHCLLSHSQIVEVPEAS